MFVNPATMLKEAIEFECPICCETFDEAEKYPMMICGAQHTCCLKCHHSIIFGHKADTETASCPFCKATITKSQAIKFRLLNEIIVTAAKMRIKGSEIRAQMQTLQASQGKMAEELKAERDKNQWLINQLGSFNKSINYWRERCHFLQKQLQDAKAGKRQTQERGNKRQGEDAKVHRKQRSGSRQQKNFQNLGSNNNIFDTFHKNFTSLSSKNLPSSSFTYNSTSKNNNSFTSSTSVTPSSGSQRSIPPKAKYFERSNNQSDKPEQPNKSLQRRQAANPQRFKRQKMPNEREKEGSPAHRLINYNDTSIRNYSDNNSKTYNESSKNYKQISSQDYSTIVNRSIEKVYNGGMLRSDNHLNKLPDHSFLSPKYGGLRADKNSDSLQNRSFQADR